MIAFGRFDLDPAAPAFASAPAGGLAPKSGDEVIPDLLVDDKTRLDLESVNVAVALQRLAVGTLAVQGARAMDNGTVAPRDRDINALKALGDSDVSAFG
jgi:hypothetical protein